MLSTGPGFLGTQQYQKKKKKKPNDTAHTVWKRQKKKQKNRHTTGKQHLNIDTKENANILKYSKAIHLYL